MAFGFKGISKGFFYISAALYPGLIFYFLVIRKTSLRYISLFVIAFALLAFIAGTSRQKDGGRGISFFRNALILFILGCVCFIANSAIILKFYPLLINIMLLAAFTATCFFPPNMIFRLAIFQDKSIKGSLGEKRINAYCRTVTYVWCVFFIVNGSIATWTIFSGSDVLWSVYNGGISYVLMGLLFAGEFIARKTVQKKFPKAVSLSVINKNSRDPSMVLCYEGAYGESNHKTWSDFVDGTAALRRRIQAIDSDKWLLYCEDCWYFLLAFAALLQCKKEILLSANASPAYIAEIRGTSGDDCAPILTDQNFPEEKNIFHIRALLNAPLPNSAKRSAEFPPIIADETSIVMYTSGSTGKPKAIEQRLTELENDNRFSLSQWGEEILKRKICSTVSPRHIYGLLYSILLPFTAGVPFRRTRIEFPEELEKLSDTKYMIFTVPAFLKRAVEIEKPGGFCLKSPWLYSAGGVLDYKTAQKTSEVFGFWPVEIYGSTETSGIGWRQSDKGPEWTVFDNAQISKNGDGCLVIRSPYIKDHAAFETGDIADILGDGRFLLNGRLDSLVKIEEKRISLLEVEDRILQSGFAADVCVIPLEGKRQYLAAVIVFNDKGKEQFAKLEKSEMHKFWREYLLQYFENIVIPKRWRYLDTLPIDAQGKIKKEDVKLLFSGEKMTEEKVIEKTDNSVSLEFSVPNTSPYFDGHFPGFPILPAVAQMELITCFASRYFGTGAGLSEIRRIKFTKLIRPFAPLLLNLAKKDNTVSFKMSSPDIETVYSSGTVVVENA